MMIASPVSPTSPTIVSASSLINSSANRISKPPRSKRRNGITGSTGDGPGRRASFIGEDVALELLLEKERERSSSAESVKMERTGSCCGVTGIPNGDSHVNGHMNGHTVQGFVPVFSTSIEDEADQFHPQQQFPHTQNGRVTAGELKPAPATNGSSELKLDIGMSDMSVLDSWGSGGNESPPWAHPQSTSKKLGVCCGNKSLQSSQTQLQHQSMHHASPNPQGRLCCSGGCSTGSVKTTLPIQQQTIPVPLASYGTGQFYPPPQYPPPPYLATTSFQQATPVWAYPTSTINHPLTPQELAWLQQQRAAGVFGQSPANAGIPPMTNSVQVDSWAHACNCGPGCDCLGCATHPFNRRTVEYVKEIQQFMEGDHHPHSSHNRTHSRAFSQQLSQTQSPQQSGFGNTIPISPPAHSPTTTMDAFNNKNITITTTPILVNSSPSRNGLNQEEHSAHQLSPSPSQDDENGVGGTPGGTDNGGELSPSGFFYVDYPFGTCAQTETGCKCGEGCTCVGCLTHGGHDGVVLEANVGENGQWGW